MGLGGLLTCPRLFVVSPSFFARSTVGIRLQTKAQLRADIITKRGQLSQTDRKQAIGGFTHNALRFIQDHPKIRSVGLYWSIPGELDVRPLLLALEKASYTIALPTIAEGASPLLFRRYCSGDTLQRHGRYKTYEPLTTAPEIIPDALIVPLVAFDRLGGRLGLGAGFYDRTLAHLREANKPVIAIGVGFALQEVEFLPREPHDESLDVIITEQDAITFLR